FGPERIFDAGDKYDTVNIYNDVWGGGNSMILPGVTIGEGAVVAAGSVVTKDVLPFTIVGGCPAKLIKERGTSEKDC
ncbi:MAG: DapH/DapD/GlmU-related protein, partial [Nitrosopumilus sp.]|nr:DapH/DapD/GlmU-related protein [Nitrosopumilus sp.]